MVGGSYSGFGVPPTPFDRYIDDVYIATVPYGDIGSGPSGLHFSPDTVAFVGGSVPEPSFASDSNGGDNVTLSLGAMLRDLLSPWAERQRLYLEPYSRIGVFIELPSSQRTTEHLASVLRGPLLSLHTKAPTACASLARLRTTRLRCSLPATLLSLIATPTASAGTASRFRRLLLIFDGLAGNDSVTIHDVAKPETIVMRPGGADYNTGTMPFAAVNSETVLFLGGTGGLADTAYLYDGNGDDVAAIGPGFAQMTGPASFNRAQGITNAYAYATAGGNDVAYLYDSPQDDLLTAAATYSNLVGPTGAVAYAIWIQTHERQCQPRQRHRVFL